MIVNRFDTDKIMPIIIGFIEAAIRRKDIRKPVSWALYQTWKVFDKTEKEMTRGERKDGEQDEN